MLSLKYALKSFTITKSKNIYLLEDVFAIIADLRIRTNNCLKTCTILNSRNDALHVFDFK